MKITVDALLEAMARKGYPLKHGFNQVNAIGVRAKDTTPNTFNDVVCALFKTDPVVWVLRTFKATTDPGLYWLREPMRMEGTAILVEGHYPNSHTLGKHRGEYDALVQVGNMMFYRDKNRDEHLNLDPNTIEQGIIGCNIHRANSQRESVQVDKWSAACQVLANPHEFQELMTLAKRSAELHGNKFSYTLLNESDIQIVPDRLTTL